MPLNIEKRVSEKEYLVYIEKMQREELHSDRYKEIYTFLQKEY